MTDDTPAINTAKGSPPASKLELFGWMMFDFANSSYTTVIVTVAYSVYFVETVTSGAGLDEEAGNLYWSLGLAASQLVVLATAPVLGAVIDFTAAKKRVLALTFLGCVAGTFALGWVGPGDVALGLALFCLSNCLFSMGENVVAAFLPELVSAERMGRISGLGWAFGYVGGLLSLIVCFPFLKDGFGPDNTHGAQRAFMAVALFFLVGGLPTFLFLRERAQVQPRPQGMGLVRAGISRVHGTLREIRRYRQLFRFLLVFFVYNLGVTVVIGFSSLFGTQELGMGTAELMNLFIVVQLSASIGAFGFGVLQDRIGSQTALSLTLLIWVAVCVGAYFSTTAVHFYVVGNLAGIAMGSSQSGARALVGMFSPADRSGEFFGFWGLVWKLSAVVGPLGFGLLQRELGMRSAVLLTAVVFVAGIVGLFFVDENEGREAAEHGAASR